MIERICLALAALAGALAIGATATYGVARPGHRIGAGLTELVRERPADTTGRWLASIGPVPATAAITGRNP